MIPKMIKKFSLLGILTALILAIVPSMAFGNGGQEPSCPKWNSVPPPLVGTITVEWVETCDVSGNVEFGCAYAEGTLRWGQNADIKVEPILLEWGVTPGHFQNHTSSDFRDRIYYVEGLSFEYVKVIAAFKLEYTDDNTFTLGVVLMPVQCESGD